MPEPVVVGVDGSPESLAALDWAADEAARRGAPLRLVHASPVVLTPLSVLALADLEQREAARVLREGEDRARARHPEVADLAAVQVREDPVRALVAESGSAGLLVLGSRGLGTVAGFLVGSVAHRVVARASCPVILVRGEPAETGPETGAETGGGAVLVGVDPHDGADAVLALAFETAERLGLPLHAVYAWTVPPPFHYAGLAAGVDVVGELAAHAERELAHVVQPWREKYPRVTVVEEAVHGRAAQVLVRRAEGVAMVLVGRRARRSPLAAQVGAVAHAVLYHVPCPVAVVPYEGGGRAAGDGDAGGPTEGAR
ncbi:universal stress protein [Kitasatospora sp. NPDC004240]